MIGKLLKFLTKAVLWTLVIALLIPFGYFAWRMGQPMDAPEYKGLTYYQYLEWNKVELEKTWANMDTVAYYEKHPKSRLNADVCFATNLAVGQAFLFSVSALHVLTGSRGIETSVQTFLPDWWAFFEGEQLVILHGNSGRQACALPEVIPDDYAAAVRAGETPEALAQLQANQE